MLETKSVHLRTGLDGIAPVREADERKALGHTGFPVLRKEYSGDTAEALEHVAQLLLLCHLGDLYMLLVWICGGGGVTALTLVTRSVAKSSLSPNLDPILSPAVPVPRRAGGTYEPFLAPAAPAPAAEASSPIPAATSPAGVSPIGAMVSL